MKKSNNHLNRLKITPLFIAIFEAIELIAALPVFAADEADGFFITDGLNNINTIGVNTSSKYMERDEAVALFNGYLSWDEYKYYDSVRDGGSVVLANHYYLDRIGSVTMGTNVGTMGSSIALGNNVFARNYSLALGIGSRAKNYSSAVGINATSDAHYSLSIGNFTKATNEYSVSIGAFSEDEATSTNIGWTPLIDKTSLTGAAWTPLGGGSFSENSVISVGRSQQGEDPSTAVTRRIVNLAAGEKDTDAVNVAQLKSVYNAIAPMAENAGQAGEYLNVNNSASVSNPTTSAKASGPYATAIGISSSATGENSLSIGRQAFTEGKDSIALGSGSKVHSSDLIAADTNGVLSIGSSDAAGGFKRRIINVADGVNANDAATVGQAQTFANSTAKTALSNVLGTSVEEQNGTFSTGDIGGTGQTTVSSAIGSVKDSIKNLYNEGTFSSDAQSQIKDLAKNSIVVKSSSPLLTVEEDNTTDAHQTAYRLNLTTQDNIATDGIGLVTSGTVFKETRVQSNGNFITSRNSAADNLVALDSQVKLNSDDIGANAAAISDSRTTIAQNTSNITANKTAIDQNTANISANTQSLTSKAASDASNIDISKWQEALGKGIIESGNTGFVTGGTMFTELRPGDGNYVKNKNTTAANLSALDEQTKRNADGVSENTAAISSNQSAITQNSEKILANTKALDTKAETNASNIDTSAWQSILGTGSVASGNSGLVTSDAVYKELRPSDDGSYVKKDQTTATNLSALDSKLGSVSQNVESLSSMSNLSETAQNNIKNIAAESTFIKAGKHIAEIAHKFVDGVKTWTVSVDDSGKVAENDKNLVTGGAVYDSIKDLKNGTSISTSEWQTKLGNGKIASSDTGLMTGGAMYDELRPSDGSYVKKDQSTATNLSNLDTNLTSVSQGLNSLKSMTNLSDEAKTNIQTLASEATVIEAGKHVASITSKTEGSVKTWTVSVDDSGTITENDAKLVTGGTVYNYVKNFTTGAGFAAVDGANLEEKHLSAWREKLGGGKIEENHTGLINGHTVYSEVRPTEGTYISKENSTAENLKSLDSNLVSVASNASNLSNLSEEGISKIKTHAANAVKINNGKHINVTEPTEENPTATWTLAVDDSGNVENDNEKLVTGGTVYSALNTELKPTTEGHFVNSTNTTAQNLTNLDSGLTQVHSAVFNNEGALKLADINLSNLSDEAKKILKGSVTVSSPSEFITVTSSDSADNSSKDYAVGLVTTETENLGEDQNALVTRNSLRSELTNQSSNVNTQLAAKANSDASNLTDTDVGNWQSKLSTGVAVAGGNTSLVTGSVLFGEVRPTEDGTYVAAAKSTAANLSSLDKGLQDLDAAKANVNGNNIDKTAWLKELGAENIASDAKGFATASQVYAWGTPQQPSGSSFVAISGSNTVGQNLTALDSKVAGIQDGLSNSLNNSFSNLTDAGKTQISNIAKDSINVVGTGLISVDNDHNGTFTVKGVAGEIAQNSAGLVTGNQVWDALQNISLSKENVQEAVKDALKDNTDISNVVSDIIANTDVVNNAVTNSISKESTLNTIASNMKAVGQINAEDTRAVSGQTVHNYLHGETLSFGKNSSVTSENGISVGHSNQVAGRDSVGLGSRNSLAAQESFAIGNNNALETGADHSVVVGHNNRLSKDAENTVVIGSNVQTNAHNAVVLGASSEGVDNAVSVGSSKVQRKIVNVARGRVSLDSTEAVTGAQLYETQAAVVQNSQAIQQNAQSIRHVERTLKKDIRRAAANSAAMASLHPMELDEDHKWSSAAGVGNYSGEQALAVGVFYKPTKNLMFNVAGSAATGGGVMVGAGVSYRFGAPSTYPSSSEFKNKVVALANHNHSLEAELKSSRAREKSMESDIAELKAQLKELKGLLNTKKTRKVSAKN